MLNWIVWNRTDYLYKNGFGVAIKPKQPTNLLILNWIVWNGTVFVY